MAAGPLQIWHPFTQRRGEPAPLNVVRAEGSLLYTDDGREIIDAISSWWVSIHGHCHPRLVSAIRSQAGRLDHVLLAGVAHPAVDRLTQKLQLVVPPNLRRVFYSDDGSTAVEVALKIAVQYWRNCGRPERHRIVALEHAYHGDTAGAMSVSSDSAFTDPFSHLRFPVHRVHSAYCLRCPVGKRRQDCGIDCIESLQTLLEANAGQIAAVIVEPLLQGAGGMIVHPVEFLQRVRSLCSAHDVLLIADEVLTGFGRTGKMFACDLAGIQPDVMCLSKGITGGFLPLGATLCTETVAQEFQEADKTFYHGHSYTGNPLACSAAVANLEVFEEEDVFGRIRRIAAQHENRLSALAFHAKVDEVRQIGTVAVIELKVQDPGYLSALKPRLYRFFLEKGVLLRPLGHIIYVLPPYSIRVGELDFVYDVVEEALSMIID